MRLDNSKKLFGNVVARMKYLCPIKVALHIPVVLAVTLAKVITTERGPIALNLPPLSLIAFAPCPCGTLIAHPLQCPCSPLGV